MSRHARNNLGWTFLWTRGTANATRSTQSITQALAFGALAKISFDANNLLELRKVSRVRMEPVVFI